MASFMSPMKSCLVIVFLLCVLSHVALLLPNLNVCNIQNSSVMNAKFYSDGISKCNTTCDDLCKEVGNFVLDKRETMFGDTRKGWAWYYGHISQYLKCTNATKFVEVGAAYGANAAYQLKHTTFLQEYHIVDPFLSGYDSSDAMSSEFTMAAKNATSSDIAKAWSDSIQFHLSYMGLYSRSQSMIPAGCKLKIHNTFSINGALFFEDDSMDVIFIDGIHTYEGVMNDIIAWFPKVKRHGAIIFNDFGSWDGVTKAVIEFSSKYNLEINMIDGTNAVLLGIHSCIPNTSKAFVTAALKSYGRRIK
jgi:Methyltransferase domain